MRCCLQFGHAGRLIAAIIGGETGLNSGMIHRAIWPRLKTHFSPKWPRGRGKTKTMPRSVSRAVFKTAQFQKLLPEGVNRPADDPRHCN
jgi:hypothetical protein